jgi:hypothetical protein
MRPTPYAQPLCGVVVVPAFDDIVSAATAPQRDSHTLAVETDQSKLTAERQGGTHYMANRFHGYGGRLSVRALGGKL